MNKVEERLLDALRCAIHREAVSWDEPLSSAEMRELIRLAHVHSILPLVAEAVYPGHLTATLKQIARQQTVHQAQRTADFLLLYQELADCGVYPQVIKGIVCRALYPRPEQRPSADEDLLVTREDYPRLSEALLARGLHVDGDPAPDADEITYRDESRGLFLEIHRQLFSEDSDAYGDCNAPFAGAARRGVTVQIQGTEIRTLAPGDHMLYLICHAYKHFLHGGVGIRQICDMGLFAQRYGAETDWRHVVSACETLHIRRFAEALFGIGERYLGLAAPEAFAAADADLGPLLEDILSGGVYGSKDINRLHSSTLTLDAVAADRSGRRRGGALHSVFLPVKDLAWRYPYLRKRPWLLPVAWTQRIWGYLTRGKGSQAVKPAETLRIGRDRIDLLRRYGIID